MSDEDLLRALAVDCPITWSHEGLDDGCFWCGAEQLSWSEEAADHDPDCPWVAARARLDLPLGKNTVREISRDVEFELNHIAYALSEVYRPDGAEIWMRSPNPSLDGGIPNELVETQEGRARVLQVLDRLASGAFG